MVATSRHVWDLRLSEAALLQALLCTLTLAAEMDLGLGGDSLLHKGVRETERGGQRCALCRFG